MPKKYNAILWNFFKDYYWSFANVRAYHIKYPKIKKINITMYAVRRFKQNLTRLYFSNTLVYKLVQCTKLLIVRCRNIMIFKQWYNLCYRYQVEIFTVNYLF